MKAPKMCPEERLEKCSTIKRMDSRADLPALIEAGFSDVDVEVLVQAVGFLQHGQNSSRPTVDQQFLQR